MGNIFETIADPSGYLTGDATTQSMFDPGGQVIKDLTGSDIGFQIADPLGLFKTPEMPEIALPEQLQIIAKAEPQAASQLDLLDTDEDSKRKRRKTAKSRFKIDKDKPVDSGVGVNISSNATAATGVQI